MYLPSLRVGEAVGTELERAQVVLCRVRRLDGAFLFRLPRLRATYGMFQSVWIWGSETLSPLARRLVL